MSEALLEVKNLSVVYRTEDAVNMALNDMNLTLNKKETLGLVGETGAGKTTTALSIMRLLPRRVGQITGGEILFEGQDLLKLEEEKLLDYRGDKISMIFQDPMTSLNPVIPVGKQVAEALELHNRDGKTEAEIEKRVDEMFELVGIPPVRKHEYPHQFSGGMRQRVVIAMALACRPQLLLADEPTTALDVTIQAQVLDMINDLKKELNTAMVLITHDLGIVAEMCDKVAVVYAGKIIESGSVEDVFDHPAHPYTLGLFHSLPGFAEGESRLHPIPGLPPDPSNLPEGCSFAPRCPRATEACKSCQVENKEYRPGHFCRCLYPEKER